MAQKSIFDILQTDLRLAFTRNKQGVDVILPGQITSKGKVEPLDVLKDIKKKGNAPDYLQDIKRVWDWWISATYDSPSSFINRKDRYNDCSFAYYNSPIFSAGVRLLADETVQPDSQEDYLQIFAKNKKFEKEINEFLRKAGVTQPVLRNIAFELALYGDSFLINSIDAKEGVRKIQPVSPYTVTDRLEFSLSHAIQQYNQKHGYFGSYVQRNKTMGMLFQAYKDNSYTEISNMYESYNFGYTLGDDYVVPPWMVTHFRRFSTQTEFYPFGQPPYIHAIAPYRQLSSTMNLQAMARVASFPLKKFTVTTDPSMTEIEQWQAVDEARQEYSNLGVSNTGKDEFTINDELWTPSDLLEIDVVDMSVDFKFVDDIELIQNQFLTAMMIPKGYLPIGDDNSWGDSGKSITQQSKVFGRLVYINQQSLIQGLIDLIKLHFSLTGTFKDEVFEVNMPFPVIEETSDRERMKSDSLRLAKDIIDNLGQSVGLDRDEALPIEIVQDIFSTHSFLDPEEVERYMKIYAKEQEAKALEMDESVLKKHNESVSKIKERYFTESRDQLIREAYFDSIDSLGTLEGQRGLRHYVNSSYSAEAKYNEIFRGKVAKTKALKESDKLQESLDELNESFKGFKRILTKKEKKEKKKTVKEKLNEKRNR